MDFNKLFSERQLHQGGKVVDAVVCPITFYYILLLRKLKEVWICFHPNDIKIVPEIIWHETCMLLHSQNALLEANHSELSK